MSNALRNAQRTRYVTRYETLARNALRNATNFGSDGIRTCALDELSQRLNRYANSSTCAGHTSKYLWPIILKCRVQCRFLEYEVSSGHLFRRWGVKSRPLKPPPFHGCEPFFCFTTVGLSPILICFIRVRHGPNSHCFATWGGAPLVFCFNSVGQGPVYSLFHHVGRGPTTALIHHIVGTSS